MIDGPTLTVGFVPIDYNTRVVLLGTLSLGAAAGVVGTLALLRRRALLGDALAHSTLPGVWIAFLFFGKNFGALMLGAMASGLLGVLVVTLLTRATRIKQDAAIGTVLSVFFGAGLMLSGWFHRNSPDASQSGIDGYLLGKTAGMLLGDAQFILTVGVAVIALVIVFFKELKLLCFDPEFAAVQGWPVSLLDFGVLILLTATTVIGLPAVGVVLMVAMLVLPGASARFWTDRLSVLLVVAAAIGFLVAGAGTFASASFERLPAGPIIVLCGTAVFAFSVLFAPRRGLLARRRREREQHDRRLRHRILRFLFERVENEDAPDPDLATIVSELGAPRRSVGRTLRTLRRNGMVESIAPRVVLNEHGWNRATRVVRTLRLWEQYLLTHANIDRDLVDPDAEIIERILPSDVIHELEVALHEAGRVPELPERATEGSAT